MAERLQFAASERIIGVAVMLACFIVVYLIAALNLPIPQWLLSAVAAVIGVLVWYRVIDRARRKQ